MNARNVYRGFGVCAAVLVSAAAIAQRNGQPASDQLGHEVLLNRGGSGGASLRFFSRDGEAMAGSLR